MPRGATVAEAQPTAGPDQNPAPGDGRVPEGQWTGVWARPRSCGARKPRPRARPAGGAEGVDPEAADPTAMEPAPLPGLSQRETEIARLVGRGLTNRQVASAVGVSPHTVNFHLRGIFRKLSISSRVRLGGIIAELDRRSDVALSLGRSR